MVNVINGVNTLESELDGKTVVEIRKSVSQALNIDPAATVRVNGENVSASFRVSDGDTVEFVKVAGQKGL